MASQTVVFFGSKSALKLEATETRSTTRGEQTIPGTPTVTLHAARESSNEQGTRYDWNRNRTLEIQIGKREITDVMAVLCNWMPSAVFDYHGSGNNKSYSLERRGDFVVVSMRTVKTLYTFNLTAAQRTEFLSFTFRRWQRQQGGLSAEVLFKMLEATYR